MARRPNRPARIKPFFVKVLFTGFSKKLSIPRKYVSLHRNTLGKECVLWSSHTSDSWRITTKKIDNDLYFKKGWKKFAKHFSLEYGDVLIFRHVQNSEFDVDMVDMTGTPKQPVVSQNHQFLRDAARVPPSNIGRQKKNIIETAALTAAEALISSSEFPAFKTIMKPAGLRPGSCLYVPAKYAKMHMKNSAKNLQIEYSNKVWIIKVLQPRPSEHRTFLSTGWSELARESNLQVDDVCVFELVSTKNITLKLTIFRHTSGENQRPKQCQVKLKPSYSEHTLKSKQLSKKAFEEAEKFKDKPYECVENQKHKKVEVKLESSDSELTLESEKPSEKESKETSNKALSEAKKFQSKSKHPSFVAVMQPAYVEHHYLHVPKPFVKEMRETFGRGSTVKLQTSNNEMRANLTLVGGQWRMNSGWRNIVKAESIEVGDICVLELINKEDDVIRISIFKCNC